MSFFKRDESPITCGATKGTCAERSGPIPGVAVSNASRPHLCTDIIMPGDDSHGKSRNDQHHCTSCIESWYKS